jgi:hypothetical protein
VDLWIFDTKSDSEFAKVAAIFGDDSTLSGPSGSKSLGF